MNINLNRLKTDNPDLVLLHGWGTNSDIWNTWIVLLSEYFSITVIDLPGLGGSVANDEEMSLDNVVSALAKKIPEQSIVLGWSLGGMLAILLADKLKEKVKGLVTIGCNPCFIAKDEWPLGMSESVFSKFVTDLEIDSKSTLNKFFMLQVLGGSSHKQALKALQIINKTANHSALLASLNLLRADVREQLNCLDVPSLHIYGEKDALAPASLCLQLNNVNNFIRTHCVKGAGHLPFISDGQELSEKLVEFSLLVNEGDTNALSPR